MHLVCFAILVDYGLYGAWLLAVHLRDDAWQNSHCTCQHLTHLWQASSHSRAQCTPHTACTLHSLVPYFQLALPPIVLDILAVGASLDAPADQTRKECLWSSYQSGTIEMQ